MSLRKHPSDDLPPAPGPVTDHEAPMTEHQLNYLRGLCRLTADTDAFDETLTQAEAEKRIAALEIRLEREQDSGAERLPRT